MRRAVAVAETQLKKKVRDGILRFVGLSHELDLCLWTEGLEAIPLPIQPQRHYSLPFGIIDRVFFIASKPFAQRFE